jgi:hypothetical protein
MQQRECIVRRAGELGQILLLTALSMTALLAMAALSVDASYMYDKRNRLHAAADAAAKSGAIEVRRNPSLAPSSLQTFGNQQVAAHGFDALTSATVVIRRCNDAAATCSAPFAGSASAVEAIVSEPTSTFFGVVLGIIEMTPAARAVAGSSPSANCLITLAPPGAVPPSMSIGNSVITMPGCSVANSGHLVTTNPNADINAQSTGVTGSCLGSGCSNITDMSTAVPPPDDPLAGLAPPSSPGGCIPAPPPVGGTLNLPAGCYTRIILGNNDTLNLAPGLYYLTGPFITGNNPAVNGTGVMFYFAGTAPTGPCTLAAPAGCIDIANRATFHLSAPTSGPYTGILFFQDRNNQLNASFSGNNPTYDLSGAMYFPGADVDFRNGLGFTNDCTLFVARSLDIDNGNGSFTNTCAAFGGSPILTVAITE